MNKILAIDPGNTESAYVLMNPDYSISHSAAGKFGNAVALDLVKDLSGVWGDGLTVAIEMVASYGMAVGKEVFDTCVWIGRFAQAAMERGSRVDYVYRMEEKMALCHDSRAKDANIRQSLIDRFARHDKKSGKGTKKNPDTFYGFRADMWSAYAVGATWLDNHREAADGRQTDH